MKTTLFLFVVLLSSVLHADVTNVIDIAALAACGTGTVNGWTLSGIDSYSGKTNVRLNDKGECLISPVFAASIKKVVLHVKSSSQSGRRLALFPNENGEFIYDRAMTCGYSPTKDTYVMQTIPFETTHIATSFKICFENPEDGDTGWGISSITVITATPPHFASPETIGVDRIHTTNVRIYWDRNHLVASNLVMISKIDGDATGPSVRSSYDFDLCANTGISDTQDRSGELTQKYPELSGEKIYYPASSKGIVKLSTGSANGRLTHVGYPDYSGMTLEITAKRYATDNNCSRIYAYYLDKDGKTCAIGSIPVGADFSTGRITLDSAPGGSAINIGNLDGTKSNRRYIIDRIAFLDNHTTTTNVCLTTVAVQTGKCRIRGLSKRTTYTATVTAIDENGNLAKASEPVTFTTPEKDGPMMLRYR